MNKSENKDQEVKLKVLLADIILKKDKNQQDYWLIRTQLDERNVKSYLAFSRDYNLASQTRSLLTNYSDMLLNKRVILTIKKKDNFEKVINLELEK